MMSESQIQESEFLRDLQQSSEARGLTFYINPPRKVVPAFLGNYQPDAIAIGPEGGIIIGVKSRRGAVAEQQLAEIARRVSREKGWEFRAIYTNPRTDEMGRIAKPTHEELQASFAEMEALITNEHPAAALVIGWAILEALSRLASADSAARAPQPFSPIRPVQTLAEEGYIENDVADRLRAMAQLRNAVVHGNFSVNVAPQPVRDLLKDLQRISSDIITARAADRT